MRRRKPASKKSPTECPRSANAYARVHLGYVALPIDRLGLLTEFVQLDYDYKDGNRQWKVKDDSSPSFELMSGDALTALKVAAQLEK